MYIRQDEKTVQIHWPKTCDCRQCGLRNLQEEQKEENQVDARKIILRSIQALAMERAVQQFKRSEE
jgi:hypothetical protein